MSLLESVETTSGRNETGLNRLSGEMKSTLSPPLNQRLLPSSYHCLNNGHNVMATDNCTLCSPLYAKGAIFSLE